MVVSNGLFVWKLLVAQNNLNKLINITHGKFSMTNKLLGTLEILIMNLKIRCLEHKI